MKRLPIGLQTFSELIREGYLYVDKTALIYRLVVSGKLYFLSRPRRFGKSLLLSTLESLFSGERALFEGLWIGGSDWEWKRYPVVRIDFSKCRVETPEDLKRFIVYQLDVIAELYGEVLRSSMYTLRFDELLRKLARRGRVVVLIDEYDKPIIDHIDRVEVAVGMREVLKGFYTVLKANDAYLRFVFLTGVSRFSKAGVFSGLNQLNDITMNEKYATLLGLTEEELVRYCREHIEGLSEKLGLSFEKTLERIRWWYDGYCFSPGCIRVYNPFSVFLLFENMRFGDYWFETGTPSFLVRLIQREGMDIRVLEGCEVSEVEFAEYELEHLEVLPLLFQSGYLTIRGYDRELGTYVLDYPNYEVRHAFMEYLLRWYGGVGNGVGLVGRLIRLFRSGMFDDFFGLMRSFFAGIPYDLRLERERYYQIVFYLLFRVLGFRIHVEVRISRGRIDVVIEDVHILVMEFKVGGSAEEALRQVKEKGYYEPYLGRGKRVYIAGIGFREGEIKEWLVEEVGDKVVGR